MIKKITKNFIGLTVLVVALVGLTCQNVNASWASNTSNVNTVNTSNVVKASATFAPIGIQVVNTGAGADTLNDISLTLTGASSFDPTTDIASLTSDSSTSGVGVYLDNTPVGTFGAEDQPFAMNPGPSYIGSGPWTITISPNANIPSGNTKNYLIVLRTASGATNGHQVRVGLASVTYATAGTKTNLAVSAPSDSTYITIDTTAPTVSSRVTQDIDGDGLIDAIKVTASESILDSTLLAANFAVAGYTVASVSGTANSSTANDTIFYLNLTEGAGTCSSSDSTGCDTDALPNVTYTAGTLTDHAGTSLANTGAVAATDGASPIAKYSKYKDTDNDGRVDRVDVTFSENIVSDGYDAADYAASTAGTINLSTDSAVATSGDDLRITILGDAGKTGGATNPQITYTSNFVNTSRGLNDSSNNAVATVTIAASDSASPVIKTVTIEDANSNGLIDKLTYTWTENVDTDDSAAPVSADAPTTLLPDGQTATYGSAAFSDPAGASAAFVITGVTGQVTKNTAAGSTAISGDLSAKWVDGSGNAAHVTGATANETITDSAAPVYVSSTGNDTPSLNATGYTNRYRIVFSENLSDVDSGAVSHPNFTMVNDTNSNAVTVDEGDIYLGVGDPHTVQIVLNQADADNYTGGMTFTYNASASGNKIQDATGNLTATFSQALTDDVKPVLKTARANNVGGTADVLDAASDWVEFKFSETMTLPTIVNLEVALLFANGATDSDATDTQNLHTTGGSDNTVSRVTSVFTNDTIRVTHDQDDSANLLTPDTDTVRVTDAGLTDTASSPNAPTETPSAVTITLADLTAPTFSTRQTQDLDLDGKIDAIKVTMSESILDSTLTLGNFAVAGYTATSVSGTANGSSANDTIFYIILTEGGSGDTSALPTVTYTQGTMTDASGNLTATTGAVASTDKATPVAMSATYKDTNTDGQVDRVDITFSEVPTLSSYNASDWAASTAGTINLGAESTAVVSGSDIRVSITGDANKTGGATDPIITYTNNSNRVTDDASNHTATFTVTATDAAAPIYVSSQTLDNNNDGTVDFVKVVYSESVLDSTVVAGDYAAGVADTTAGNLTESFTSGTPSSGNATDTANDASIYVGVVSSGETLTAKKTDYTLKIQQTAAITDALSNSLASFSSQTSTDAAKPIIKTVTIEDTDGDGLVDKVTYTWSENIDTDDSSAPVSADLPTTLLPDGSTATFGSATISDPAGSATTVVVTGVTGQSTVNTAASSTAISGDLSAKWVDGAANVPHATGGTGNESITDSAKPVFKTSTTSDANANGTVDTITLVYSEAVAITDGSAGDAFPGVAFANGCTAANANYASSSTTSSTITVTGCTANSTSITASPTYTSASGQIDDLATSANEMANSETVTGTDGAGPVILTANVDDADSDGDLDTANFTYSESLTNTAAAANGFDVTSSSNHGTCNTESADPAVSSSLALTFACSSKSTAVGDLSIVFTANSGVQDSAGNNSPTKTLTSASSPAITDIAAPVALSATVSKSVVTGNLQNGAVIDVIFSEPVTPTSVTNSNWKFSRNGVETLATGNWPDGATIAYAQGSTSSAVKMTLSAITTSGAWGPYTAKVNLASNNTSTIVDASSNQADVAASDVSITGVVGPSLNSTPVVTVDSTTATIGWTTVSSTTSNKVKYGTTTSVSSTSTSGTPGESSATHSISLSSLTASTLYYYQVCFTDTSEYCTTIDHFTTGATVTLAVTQIAATKTTMTADASYTNGGSWTFNFTVPTSETNLQLKFGDWVSGANTIAVASNMRIYSAQSSNAASSGAAITLSAANTYSTALALTSDLDSATAGRQVQVVVDLKVPLSTSGGSYSTNYSVQSSGV